MLSTLTSVISGRAKICDIDMLLIVGTSSLLSNVMPTVHELMTLLPLHWACKHTTNGIGIKKGNYKVMYISKHIN